MADIIVGPDHPAWKAIDDDDWNGATFGNWLRTVGSSDIILIPPKVRPADLLERMEKVMIRHARSVRTVGG